MVQKLVFNNDFHSQQKSNPQTHWFKNLRLPKRFPDSTLLGGLEAPKPSGQNFVGYPPKKKTTTQFDGVETPKIRGSNFGFQTDSQIKNNLVLLIPEAQTN